MPRPHCSDLNSYKIEVLMPLPPITTQRLLIRPFEPDDWLHVLAYTSDPSTMTYIPEGVFTADKAQAFVAENSSEHAEAYAIVPIGEQHVIGHMKFSPLVRAPNL